MVPHPGASSPPESSAELAEAAAHPPPYSRPTETGYSDDEGEAVVEGGGDVLHPEDKIKEEPPKRLGWEGIPISLIVAAKENPRHLIDLCSEFRARAALGGNLDPASPSHHHSSSSSFRRGLVFLLRRRLLREARALPQGGRRGRIRRREGRSRTPGRRMGR